MSKARDLANIPAGSGDLDVDSGTLFVDASADSVGIGTSSPARKLSVVVSGTGNVATLESNAGPNLEFKGTEASGRTYLIGEGLVNAGNFSVYDGSGSAERLVITSSGSVGIGCTPSSTLQVQNSAGASLYLGFTGGTNNIYDGVHIFRTAGQSEIARFDSSGLSFDSGSNHLDDYEEGDWTPTVSVGTVNAGNARYTKVGNLVTVMGNLTSFSNRTSTSNIIIGGLPFTSASDNRTTGAVLANYVNAGDAGYTAFISQSASTLAIYDIAVGNNFSVVTYNNLNSSSASIYFTISYRA